jgi:uncharacterized C2H2 Zn-finger protein
MPTAPRRFVNFILDLLFPCDHAQESWPQTRDGRTYKSCLRCGNETEYDMQYMCNVTPAFLRWKKKHEAKKLALEALNGSSNDGLRPVLRDREPIRVLDGEVRVA